MATFGQLFGMLRTFFANLTEEVVALGGHAGMLRNLGKESVRPALRELAQALIKAASPVYKLSGSFKSHGAAITAGGYKHLWGLANSPEKITAPIHPVDGEFELEHPDEDLTAQQVWDLLSESMGDLAEFEIFGIKKPKVQERFPVVVLWKEGDNFGYGILSAGACDVERSLVVNQVGPGYVFRRGCRFLVRK